MDVATLTEKYVKIRDARLQLKKEFEEKDRELKGLLEKIEGVMLKSLSDATIDSMKTSAGTVYRQIDMYPIGSDWPTFYAFVKDNDAFEALERRIKKGFVADYIEEHGEPPPGVSTRQEYVVRVRRT